MVSRRREAGNRDYSRSLDRDYSSDSSSMPDTTSVRFKDVGVEPKV